MFKRGDSVICVNTSGSNNVLQKDAVYEVLEDQQYAGSGVKVSANNGRYAYYYRRFQVVNSKELI